MRIQNILEFSLLFFLLFSSTNTQTTSKEVLSCNENQKEINIPSVFIIDVIKARIYIEKDFENDLMSSKNPYLFTIVGASRLGKSTLFNTIINGEYNSKTPFKVASGNTPVTNDFSYAKINSKKLAELHGIKKDVIDADIFLIDSEGLQNLQDRTHSRLYLGGTVLQSIISELFYFCKSYPGTTDYEKIKSYLVMGKLLGGDNDFIKTLIIMSGIFFNGEEESERLSEESKKNIIDSLFTEHLPIDNNKLDALCLKNLDLKDEYMLGVKKIVEKILDLLQEVNPKGGAKELLEKLQITSDLINDSKVELNTDNTDTIFKDFVKKIIKKSGDNILENYIEKIKKYIMDLSPAQLRELDKNNNRNKELELSEKNFKEEIEEKVLKKYNFYSYILEKVINESRERLYKNYETQVKNFISEKFEKTIIYPKNIDELCKEHNISELSIGKTYTLYYNKKPYKVKAIEKDKITLEGLEVKKKHREWDSTDKKELDYKTTDISNVYFNSDLMNIVINSPYFKKEKYDLKLGLFSETPVLNWFIKKHHIEIIEWIEIKISDDLIINTFEGNNISCGKNQSQMECRVKDESHLSDIKTIKISLN